MSYDLHFCCLTLSKQYENEIWRRFKAFWIINKLNLVTMYKITDFEPSHNFVPQYSAKQ